MINLLLLLIAVMGLPASALAMDLDLDALHWFQQKSVHFEVIYPVQELSQTASQILRRAEEDYERILDRIGAYKVDNFWTWDERVKIVYFQDHDSFVKATGQPAWSKGASLSHMSDFKMRLILSYRGQDDFLDAVLPHEISHLVLHDFMKNRQIPRWFDEGVAQFDEINNNEEHRLVLAKLVQRNNSMPLAMLEAFPAMVNEDPLKAAIFYAESLYIVDFLIKTYGKDKFGDLCRHLRDGLTFEAALGKVYYPTIVSWKTLEEKWEQYMLSFLRM